MPLKLSLKPGEAVIVNGAVLRNGDRRGTMLLENKAQVLREKDVVYPDDIKTSIQAAYFAIMQLYLTGETGGLHYNQALSALSQSQGLTSHKGDLVDIGRKLAAGQTYAALIACRRLMAQAEGQEVRHG